MEVTCQVQSHESSPCEVEASYGAPVQEFPREEESFEEGAGPSSEGDGVQYQIPDIVTTDEAYDASTDHGDDSAYGASNDGESYRRDSDGASHSPGLDETKYESWEGSDSGVDGGNSSGCSTADDCPVVSVNDVVAYYEVRTRRVPPPPLNVYNLDIDKMALAATQVNMKHSSRYRS